MPESWICRAGGVWRGFFFFFGLGDEMDEEDGFDDIVEEDGGSERCELKDEMNSIDRGVSPRSSLKWLAASSFESVDAY